MSSIDRRSHLVNTAHDLFEQNGFHVTGIDRILEESGVAKMTLYNHFKSKDELILATLRLHDEQFRNWFMRSVEKKEKSPNKRLVAIFDVLHEWFSDKAYRGCMFLNATAEFSEIGSPIRALCAESNKLLLDYIRSIAKAAAADDPDGLAEALMLLMEGAICIAHLTGNNSSAKQAKKAAQTLVKAAGI